jgi:hypothetical protein
VFRHSFSDGSFGHSNVQRSAAIEFWEHVSEDAEITTHVPDNVDPGPIWEVIEVFEGNDSCLAQARLPVLTPAVKRYDPPLRLQPNPSQSRKW